MAGVGDGTGMNSTAPEMEGLTSDDKAVPNKNSGPYGQGEGGKGTELVDSRTSPIGGGKE